MMVEFDGNFRVFCTYPPPPLVREPLYGANALSYKTFSSVYPVIGRSFMCYKWIFWQSIYEIKLVCIA